MLNMLVNLIKLKKIVLNEFLKNTCFRIVKKTVKICLANDFIRCRNIYQYDLIDGLTIRVRYEDDSVSEHPSDNKACIFYLKKTVDV